MMCKYAHSPITDANPSADKAKYERIEMNWNRDKHRSFISPTRSNHRSLAGNTHLPDRVLIISGSAVLYLRDSFIVILQ